jgi:hypothetical protein
MIFWFLFLRKNNQRFIWFIAAVLSTVLIIVYGARGSLLVLVLLGIFIILFDQRIRLSTKILSVSITGIASWLIAKYDLVSYIVEYIYVTLDIKSYAMLKYRNLLESSFVATSSGRDTIYIEVWNQFLENMLFGNGISVSQIEFGYASHNFVLQILIETGIVGLLAWLVVWAILGFKYIQVSRDKDYYFFLVVTLILVSAFGRLLVSSDMWLRPEFWFVMAMLMKVKFVETADNLSDRGFIYEKSRAHVDGVRTNQ